jgi:hypothetical protein
MLNVAFLIVLLSVIRPSVFRLVVVAPSIEPAATVFSKNKNNFFSVLTGRLNVGQHHNYLWNRESFLKGKER